MAEMNTEWQKTERDDGVQEYFWLGEFIQSDTWNGTLPPKFKKLNYPYQKDVFSDNPFNNEIHVTEMTHATTSEYMLSIINYGGFRPKEKRLCPPIGSMRLVWFGLKIGENEIDCMKEHRKGEVQRLMQSVPKRNRSADDVLKQIARTPAFQPLSLHGNCKFTVAIKEVMETYTKQFCADSVHPEMRKLGTFAYKQEIMHAILVCPPNTTTDVICPRLDANPVIQPDDLFETWTWKPHSTQDMSVSDNASDDQIYIRWEHVSFAFYIPDGNNLMIPNLESRVSLCLQRTTEKVEKKVQSKIVDANEGITGMLHFIESMEVTERKSAVDTLIRMIAAYLKDERLYEKTLVNNVFEKNICVQLEPVVQRVRVLLKPEEFESLNWTPLTDWMTSLTRHSSVLRVIQEAKIKW